MPTGLSTSRQAPDRSRARVKGKEVRMAPPVKPTPIRKPRIAVILALAVMTVSMHLGYAAVPQETGPVHLGRHQRKALQKTAHTADDFWVLSKYYAQESERLERKAKAHQEEAEGYASGRVFEPKFPGGLLAHCRHFAWYYHQKAEQRKSLATHY